MTTSTPHRHIKKRLIKTVGAHTPCSCGYIQGGDLYFYIKDYQGNVRVALNQANQPVEVNSYWSCCKGRFSFALSTFLSPLFALLRLTKSTPENIITTATPFTNVNVSSPKITAVTMAVTG